MYCASNNGTFIRAVDKDYVAASEEVLFPEFPTSEQLLAAFPEFAKEQANQSILMKIVALEATITPRRLREAMLGTDKGWLATVDEKIAELRKTLQ